MNNGVRKNNEHQVLSFNATGTKVLNQRSHTSYWESLDTNYASSPLFPNQIFAGAAFYSDG